jgi:hypothetical protein
LAVFRQDGAAVYEMDMRHVGSGLPQDIKFIHDQSREIKNTALGRGELEGKKKSENYGPY